MIIYIIRLLGESIPLVRISEELYDKIQAIMDW